MKKIIFIFCILVTTFAFFGCQTSQGDTGKIEIEEVETLELGESCQLNVKLTALKGELTYKSSDNDILTVNEDGLVTALSVGKAKITVSVSTNGKLYTDSIEIEVISNEEEPVHEHVECSICGKCVSEECDGADEDKCYGHIVHEHVKCATCGKCVSEECDGDEELRCLGHEQLPSHTHDICDTCGKCLLSDCEEEKCEGHEDILPGHNCLENASDWISTEKCGKNVLQQKICLECDEVLEERRVDLEHEYESTILSTKTCVQDGEIKYTCTRCDHYYVRKDYSIGHVKDEIKIITEATENTLGTKQIKCINCDHVFKEFGYVNNAYDKNGKLSVNGADLVNQYGEKVQLYGLSTHGIQWFSKVVNFDTICEIQENFGNNIIRFAMYTDENGYCDGSEATKKMMLETLHRGIEIATDLGLYVIVDWHMVGAENVLDKNPLTYLEQAKEFFAYITEYYKDQDNILYEIMNEPNGSTTWADCKKYANEIIPIIRKNTDAIVLVGNPKWTADLNSVMKDPLTGYNNIMYTYHFYAADHSSTTQVVKAYDSGFPVFISEFGFMESSGDGNISETNGNKWKKVLDDRNISYVAWNISNSKGSASIFKYNTTALDDVSDSNLKVWGVYLKNWYRAKSLNVTQEPDEEELNPTVELEIEVPDWSSSYECFIISSNDSTSRLDYSWSSTNEAVLTVSEYSTLKIIGDGSCSIICKNYTTGEVGILDIIVKNGSIDSWSSRYTE